MAPETIASSGRGICIMGRSAFGTGIGLLTESIAELLARRYDVSVFDLHGPPSETDSVRLTNGRFIPLTRDLSGFDVYFYADVLWNGVGYSDYVAPPSNGYRIAYLAFDSDELPPEWVTILNRDFDAVFFTSPHLIEIAVSSGVQIEIGSMPLALDIENLVANPYRPSVGRPVRFGTLSAYHPRKGLESLVIAFLQEFGDSHEAQLVIHSNIAIGPTASAVRTLIDASGTTVVEQSTAHLMESQKNELLETFDVYVNAASGEGYSVGPREALACGKVLVVSDLGAHQPLLGVPGVFAVPLGHETPARYPEIDNRQFGLQRAVTVPALRKALREAWEFVTTGPATETAGLRKLRGSEFSLQRLERDYWAWVDPDSRHLRRPQLPKTTASTVQIPAGHTSGVRPRSGRFGARLGARKLVVRAHDAGFFSLFNTYLTHLVWSMHESPQNLVLPDWDAGRLLDRIAPDTPVSFCYSRPDQGNLWNHLFEPPYGLEPTELDDVEFLYDGSSEPHWQFNENREPDLTYVHAYKLYHSPAFGQIRKQYKAVLDEHVRLRPHLQSELDTFLESRLDGRFLIGAHIKHPSHAIEQPDGSIADRHTYLDAVRRTLADRGLSESGDDWRIFLATEQERVVDLFRSEFGERVIQFADVERIPTATDDAFDSLDEASKLQDGHQLQHILAADTSRWSPRLAWEVIRDARVLAASDVVFHAVSNVATAVSFFGPDAEMRFVDSD